MHWKFRIYTGLAYIYTYLVLTWLWTSSKLQSGPCTPVLSLFFVGCERAHFFCGLGDQKAPSLSSSSATVAIPLVHKQQNNNSNNKEKRSAVWPSITRKPKKQRQALFFPYFSVWFRLCFLSFISLGTFWWWRQDQTEDRYPLHKKHGFEGIHLPFDESKKKIWKRRRLSVRNQEESSHWIFSATTSQKKQSKKPKR